MKKFLILALSLILFAGCKTGSYSISSGKADGAAISFTSPKAAPITVVIDERTYTIKTVATNAIKKKTVFKPSAENTIKLTPGTHDVKVIDEKGQVYYSKKLFLSNQEHRMIEF